MTNQEFAEIFLREYDEVKKSCSTGSQAMLYLDTLVNNDPHNTLELLAVIIECCKNNNELTAVAAGPLENLFVYHGYEIINDIKKKADCNKSFQLAVSGVWLDEEDDAIFFQWLELMKRYNFVGDNPRKTLNGTLITPTE